jgi:hypothetical protein
MAVMAQAEMAVQGLPEAPLDAAAAFHAQWLPEARAALAAGHDLVLVFAPAGHEHRGWRLAAVQELAREAAPLRVNALVATDGPGLMEMLGWLEQAEAITGEMLTVDGKSGERG